MTFAKLIGLGVIASVTGARLRNEQAARSRLHRAD